MKEEKRFVIVGKFSFRNLCYEKGKAKLSFPSSFGRKGTGGDGESGEHFLH